MRNPAAKGKPDANHAQIVGWYQALHCGVVDMHGVGFGFPDVLIHCSGLCEPAEIKTPEGELSASQLRFIRDWKGPKIRVIRTQDDVIEHVLSMRKRAIR